MRSHCNPEFSSLCSSSPCPCSSLAVRAEAFALTCLVCDLSVLDLKALGPQFPILRVAPKYTQVTRAASRPLTNFDTTCYTDTDTPHIIMDFFPGGVCALARSLRWHARDFGGSARQHARSGLHDPRKHLRHRGDSRGRRRVRSAVWRYDCPIRRGTCGERSIPT